MATIRSSCPIDGKPADVSPEVAAMFKEAGEYGFMCPRCQEFHRKPMDDRIEELLRSVGVPYKDEPPIPVGPPAITADEVAAFASSIRTAPDDLIAKELGL